MPIVPFSRAIPFGFYAYMFLRGVNIRKEPFRDLRGPFSVQKSDMRATSAADPLATFKVRGKGKSDPNVDVGEAPQAVVMSMRRESRIVAFAGRPFAQEADLPSRDGAEFRTSDRGDWRDLDPTEGQITN
ncbi:hypothetical protein [Mesorhizobium sp.]|uniref:hypothetical protein n=1 Tax=Mesorhizobium sp. TaxID=1871066 RepID=UPI000FE935F6|nr:hypothetical protein [Mesorhizobium sp.]RWO21601.1 MAG: hypothetical protein EOS09_23090 [Mesorhizobium sp.]